MVRWNTSIFPVYADAGAAMDGEDVLLREITLEAHDTLSETDKLGTVVRENGVGQSVLIRSLDKALFYPGYERVRFDTDAEPTMIVQDRQGIAADSVAQ